LLLDFSHRAQLRSGVKSCIHLDELLTSPGIPRICIRGEIVPGRGSIRADDARILSRDGATRRLVVFALNRAHIGLRFELRYSPNVVGAPETGGNIISDGDPIGANGARIARLRYGRAANRSLIFIIAAPKSASLELSRSLDELLARDGIAIAGVGGEIVHPQQRAVRADAAGIIDPPGTDTTGRDES
jgi:hypothetical protein